MNLILPALTHFTPILIGLFYLELERPNNLIKSLSLFIVVCIVGFHSHLNQPTFILLLCACGTFASPLT